MSDSTVTKQLDIPPREAWYGLHSGTVLADRYRIERLISRGGMGAVFEATQLGLDRQVAIKMLLPTLTRDEKVQERFRREARSVASLRHPNIIQIFDYGISEHGPYIVMELLRGQSLRNILKQGVLPLKNSVELLEQMCSAVSEAHNAGIIHRDLKPDNIIVEESGGKPIVKVLDFGIAKIREVQAEEIDTNLTGAHVIGSPAYMSPEQSMGVELDGRSDVYSLGIVLFEMLTGSTPFGKAQSHAMLMHQVNTPPPPLSDFRSDVPQSIESVVAKALVKNRDMRFASTTDFSQTLRLALDDPKAFDTQFDLDYATSSINERVTASDSGSYSMSHRRRLAILPLRNLTGDPEIEFLGFALADSIITNLAPIKSLIVRPSSAVEKYRNLAGDPRDTGKELAVETILTGSYLKAGDQFRVNVQLIDVSRNEILWQERLNLKFDDVISLQDMICEEVIKGLKLKITTGEQEAIKRDEPRNLPAYEFFLRGIAIGNAGTSEHKQALEMLEASVGLDPSYAPAWAALAGRYINARGSMRDESMFEKAEAAARKSLELNPQLPMAFFWLAIHYGEKGDLKNAIATCKQLLQVAPNSEYAYQAMGHAYDYAGLPDIALTLFRKAAEINPVTYPYMIGLMHYQKGDMAEARREFEVQPDACHEMVYWLAIVDFIEGKTADAISRLDSFSKGAGGGIFHSLATTLLGAMRGDSQSDSSLLEEILNSGVQLSSYYYYMIAQIYAQLGQIDKAIDMLANTVKTGYGNYPFLMSDPLLDPVRQHPNFAEIAKSMKKLQTQLQLLLVTG